MLLGHIEDIVDLKNDVLYQANFLIHIYELIVNLNDKLVASENLS